MKTFNKLGVGDSIWFIDKGIFKKEIITAIEPFSTYYMNFHLNDYRGFLLTIDELNEAIVYYSNGTFMATSDLQYLKSSLNTMTCDITPILDFIYEKG